MNMNAGELKRITPEAFDAMEKDDRISYELIDGIVMMSPSPTFLHQMISGNLYQSLRAVLQDKGCYPIQDFDLQILKDRFRPDLMVVCDPLEDLIHLKRYEKPPLIVIEIVSPSSSSLDYISKRAKYASFGVKEYWIVSPEEKCITVLDFTSNTHERNCAGLVKSLILPEIEMNLTTIFA